MNNDLYITIYEDDGKSDGIPFYADYPLNEFSVYDVDFSFDYNPKDGSFNMVTFFTYEDRNEADDSLPTVLSCVDCVKIISDFESVNFIVRPQIFARLQTELSKYIG